MDDLHKQIAAAKAAKDAEKVKTLETQIHELYGKSQENTLRQKLMTDIEAVLTPEQKPRFQQIKDDMFNPAPKPKIENDPAMLMKAIDSLNLPKERQQKIQALVDDFTAKSNSAKESRVYFKTQGPEVGKKMMAQLSEEEQAKVKAWRPTGKTGDWHTGTKNGDRAKGNAKHRKARDATAPAATEQPK